MSQETIENETDEVVTCRRLENGREWIEDENGNVIGEVVRSSQLCQRMIHITENGVYVNGAKLQKATHE